MTASASPMLGPRRETPSRSMLAFEALATPSGRSVMIPEGGSALAPPRSPRGPRVSPWLRFRQEAFFEIIERAAALVLILALAPVMIAVYILVRLTSRGPGFFWQTRLGRHEVPFQLVKFRSMTVDAEAKSGPAWSTANDPRVTPIGAFLRRSHLDELPQLWNVLRGQMSFIGPRPERPHFVKKIRRRYRYYALRHAVKPGITGFAQVRFRAEQAIEDSKVKVSYDLVYFDQASPVLDLKILIATFSPNLLKERLLRRPGQH